MQPQAQGTQGTASTRGPAPAAEAWQMAWAQVLPLVEQKSRQRRLTWPLQVLRSSQLDAQRLDSELTTMLHEQFMKVFSYFHLVFYLTVWQGKSTPGSQLLNLRYRNEWQSTTPQVVGRTGVEGPQLSTIQRALFGSGYVLVPYLWARLNRMASHGDWMDRNTTAVNGWVWGAMRSAESLYRGASLMNILAFLAGGRYPSLLERLIGARLVYRQRNMTRVISFEYLNRQLVWQELSELLLFLLPLLSFTRLRAALASYLPDPARVTIASMATQGGGVAAASDKDGAAVGPGQCPICGMQDILLPFQALPCCHAFCYYCLCSSTQADAGFKCPLDNQRVQAMRRWPGRRLAVQRHGNGNES